MNLYDLSARVERLDHLPRGLAKEEVPIRQCNDPPAVPGTESLPDRDPGRPVRGRGRRVVLAKAGQLPILRSL